MGCHNNLFALQAGFNGEWYPTPRWSVPTSARSVSPRPADLTAHVAWSGTNQPGRSVLLPLEMWWPVPIATGAPSRWRCVILWLVYVFSLNSNIVIWIEKLAIFYRLSSKNPKKIKLHPPSPYKYPPHCLTSSNSHTNSFSVSWYTYTMSSSSSSEIEDQIVMTFFGRHESRHEHSHNRGCRFFVDTTVEASSMLRQP
jgi:hypothetical protein